MGSPSGRVLEQGPDWFLVATEACGGGTPHLSSVLEVLGYVGIYGCRGYVGGPPGGSWGRGRTPHPRGPLVAPLTNFFRLYISIYPKNIGGHNRTGGPPPQAFVATKNLLGARSGTLPEGEPITGGHLHHPGALHDEEGVAHPPG